MTLGPYLLQEFAVVLSRERMLTALDRRQPDRVPIAFGFHLMTLPQIPNRNPDEYFRTDIRYVSFKPPHEDGEFLRYLEGLPKHIHVGGLANLRTYWEWSYHPHITGAEPLATVRTIEELDFLRLPEITDPSRYRGLSEEVHSYQDRSLAVMGIPPHLGGEVFEPAWRLRGFQRLLLDLRRNRDLANYLFDQITAMLLHNAVILAQAGVDILCLDDDVGAPTSMIISPTTWKEFLKPRLMKVIEFAKEAKPDISIFYHSDGYIEPIIPDLIEIGVDALNPVQPDVMNPAKLKEKYGDRLAFWGTVGTQTLWAWGSPKDIEEEVKLRIETVGRDGGFIICPAYDIDLPEIPLENIIAFRKAAERFGNYQ
ncbi:MAG: uroporphyrinogen decarboxylase family protein [Candidatus Bathyarchaeia archaeon]